MKTKLLIIFIFSYSSIFSQTPSGYVTNNSNGAAADIQQIFSHLDTNSIPTKILYNKVISFVNINKFDGIDSIGIANIGKWRELYFEINKACVTKQKFPDISNTFQKANNMFKQQNVIPIGILNVKYNILDDSALIKGLVTFQNYRFSDVQGRTKSPYNNKRLFTAASLVNINSPEANFLISDDYYFSNDTLPVDHFEIDFDDGAGFNVYQKNQTVRINYSTSGQKTIQINTVFKNNSSLFAAFTINLSCPGVPTPDWGPNDFPNFVPGWTTPIYSYNYNYVNTNNPNDNGSSIGSAEVTIWYAPGHTVLTNPLILLDGFDPNVPQYKFSYCDLYDKLNEQQTIGYLQSGSGCYDYDIVVVDWDYGADWIQKNALVLVNILQWINANKVGNNPNILIGPSMGGIIGRYALCYMEKNTIPHDVSTFVLLDSPNQGANFPLGLQLFMNYFSSYDDVETGLNVINSPAAKQLLNYHYDQWPTLGCDPLRTSLMQDLRDNLGYYPTQPLLVGISNGSGYVSDGINAPTGQPTLQNNGKGSNSTNTLNPQSEILDVGTSLEGLILLMYSQVWALPDGNNGPIFQVWEVNSGTTTYSVEGTQPYDGAPGSYYPYLDDYVSSGSTWSGSTETTINLNQPFFDFIPTCSALDYMPINYYGNNYTETDLDGDDFAINIPIIPYNNPDNYTTPFDYILTAPATPTGCFDDDDEPTYPNSFNEAHTLLTAEKRDFLLNIIGNKFPSNDITSQVYIQNQTLTHPYPQNAPIQASYSISAGSDVNPYQIQGNVTIPSGSNVVFHAGNVINLKPGFDAKNNFDAYVGYPCTTSPCVSSTQNNKLPPTILSNHNSVKSVSKINNPDKYFSLYPNPNYGSMQLKYKIPEEETGKFVVYDMLGNELLSQLLKGGENIVSISHSNLPVGIYFYHAFSNNKQIASDKIVVIK
ncbi:MAG: T9SS type A sorting domain-containing protein [Bacteroidales bacterium]|jgi:hypothetical protein